VQGSTEQSTTGINHGHGAVEAPPVFKAGWFFVTALG
jgi:hypothetical protein